MSTKVKGFKERRTFQDRINDVEQIRRHHPDKVPIVIERFEHEKNLPLLDKAKFLVPDYITVSELSRIIRRRLSLHPNQTFFLMVNAQTLVSSSTCIADIYDKERDEDGFLYMVYGSENAFGAITTR